LLVVFASCRRAPESLDVYAAASLRDLVEAAATTFEAETGTRLRVSTGGSNLVANQLLAGARADVFLPASPVEIARLVDAGRVDERDVRALFTNRLVVIAPAGRGGAFEPASLARATRVALAHPGAVPAGRYAKEWLVARGLWDAVEPNVVRCLDVRAALAAVASGGAEFGIVYASDAAHATAVEVVYAVPASEGPRIVYPGAVLKDARHPKLARLLLERLAEPRGAWATAVADAGFELVEGGN